MANFAIREIPEGSIEIQTGLWLYSYDKTIGGNTYNFKQLFSAEGYCFWNAGVPENYDEYGNLLPLEQRIFAQWAALSIGYTTIEQINADFHSVPVQDGYEIVSVGGNTEIA